MLMDLERIRAMAMIKVVRSAGFVVMKVTWRGSVLKELLLRETMTRMLSRIGRRGTASSLNLGLQRTILELRSEEDEFLTDKNVLY